MRVPPGRGGLSGRADPHQEAQAAPLNAPFCDAVSLFFGFAGWVLALWAFLRPERDRSGRKLAGGGMSCALALLSQLSAIRLEVTAGDPEMAFVQASGAAVTGRYPVCDDAAV